MAVSRQSPARRTEAKTTVGLLAIGSSGSWEVSIDQTTQGRDRWFAQIEGPSVYIYFEIASLEVIDQAIGFLSQVEDLSNSGDSLALANGKTPQIVLLRDDEFADRFFLLVETSNRSVVRLTLAGKDLADLADALRDAKEGTETK